jgi:hypothetical protein
LANAPGGGFGQRTGRPEYPEELLGSLSVTGNETIIGLGAGPANLQACWRGWAPKSWLSNPTRE